jgi:AmmeMemoRadiSam system protein B
MGVIMVVELRRADLAGAWYPGREAACRKAIEEFSSACRPCPGDGVKAVGGILPHAGWAYSGKIACNVIMCLRSGSEPDTCIIFGHHMHTGSGNLIMKRGRWDTPLGHVEVDSAITERLVEEFRFTEETASHYQQDNTIEVQLPFIKYFFPETRIVPIGLPPSAASLEIARRVARISEEMGKRAVVLGSTDLTHYGYNYGYTPKGVGKEAVQWVRNVNDRRAIDLMIKMDPKGLMAEALTNYNVCCSGAAGAAIMAAKELGAGRGEEVDYFTSYDIRPDSSFVGYVGVVFYR